MDQTTWEKVASPSYSFAEQATEIGPQKNTTKRDFMQRSR